MSIFRHQPATNPDVSDESVSVTDTFLCDLTADTGQIRLHHARLVRAVQGLALAVLALGAVQASKGGRS